jgi:Zn-dependent protease with chaperone function
MKFLSEYLIEQNILNEFDDKDKTRLFISFLFSVVFITTKLIVSTLITNIMYKKPAKVDKEFTKKFQELTNDKDIIIKKLNMKEPNAFFAGGKFLYYTSGIKKIMNENELMAILIHEYGHYKGKHLIKRNVILGITQLITLTFFTSKYFKSENRNFLWGGLSLAGIEEIGYDSIIGKQHEYFADSYTVQYGYKKHMISALRKAEKYVRNELCKDMTKGDCDVLMSNMSLLNEHPEFKKRIKNIMDTKLNFSSISGLKNSLKFLLNLKKKLRSED